MVDTDKKEFWAMLNITMELCNRPPLSKEAVLGYWNMLNNFELKTVRSALDTWVDSSSKSPTPHDIKDLCKPKPTIFSRLPSPLAIAENHRHAVEVKQAVEQMTKPKRDMMAWAKKIIANPDNYPDISFKLAKEALGNEI